MRYKVALQQTEDGVSVWVPGLRGCWSQATTAAEALANIEDAIREYFAVVEANLRDARAGEVEIQDPPH